MQLSDSDRRVLAAIGKKLGKKALDEIATVATSETILAWYRKFIDQKGHTSKPPQGAWASSHGPGDRRLGGADGPGEPLVGL